MSNAKTAASATESTGQAAKAPAPTNTPAVPKTNTLTISYKWIQADHFTKGRTRRGKPVAVQSIIVHSTEGSKAGDLDTLLHGDAGRPVSVHWYITRTGEIFHMVDDADTAWHAGATSSPSTANEASVGIEHEHVDGPAQVWPEAQVQASAHLIAYLHSKHGAVPVYRHADVAIPAGRKSDPVGFPFGTVHEIIAGLADTHISAAAIA